MAKEAVHRNIFTGKPLSEKEIKEIKEIAAFHKFYNPEGLPVKDIFEVLNIPDGQMINSSPVNDYKARKGFIGGRAGRGY